MGRKHDMKKYVGKPDKNRSNDLRQGNFNKTQEISLLDQLVKLILHDCLAYKSRIAWVGIARLARIARMGLAGIGWDGMDGMDGIGWKDRQFERYA